MSVTKLRKGLLMQPSTKHFLFYISLVVAFLAYGSLLLLCLVLYSKVESQGF